MFFSYFFSSPSPCTTFLLVVAVAWMCVWSHLCMYMRIAHVFTLTVDMRMSYSDIQTRMYKARAVQAQPEACWLALGAFQSMESRQYDASTAMDSWIMVKVVAAATNLNACNSWFQRMLWRNLQLAFIPRTHDAGLHQRNRWSFWKWDEFPLVKKWAITSLRACSSASFCFLDLPNSLDNIYILMTSKILISWQLFS